jgi:hypothetical protein
MSDKTSQKTEDEMLDQTFGGYDDEMTVNTEQTQTSETGAKPKAEKKKSNNTLVYAGGGIAAIAILGYMFMGNKTAPQQHAANPAPAQQASAPQTPPVQQPPVADAQPQVPQSGSAQSAAAAYLGAQNNANNAVPNQAASVAPASSAESLNSAPVAQATQPEVQQPAAVADNSNSATPAAPVVVASTPAPVVINTAPATPAVQTGAVGAGSNNEVQVALVNQLKTMFDQQTKELKGSLDNVGDRVGNLEKAVSDQKDINKEIDERLARLEAGKPTKVVKAQKAEDTDKTDSTSTADTTKAKTEKAPAEHKVRHVVRRHVVRKAVADSDSSSNVLIDKSQAPAASTVHALPSVDIYSIYAGRVWTRNGDGTLSTYSAGDRLPTGEVVKSVDDNHLVTNKRVINAK